MNDEVWMDGTEQKENIVCSDLNVSGAVTVENDIRANRITVTGTVSTGGDVEAETISVSGSLRISGQLRANDVTVTGFLRTNGDSTIETVVSSGEVVFEEFDAKRVVGDEVFVENVSADTFRLGEDVGPPDV